MGRNDAAICVHRRAATKAREVRQRERTGLYAPPLDICGVAPGAGAAGARDFRR